MISDKWTRPFDSGLQNRQNEV